MNIFILLIIIIKVHCSLSLIPETTKQLIKNLKNEKSDSDETLLKIVIDTVASALKYNTMTGNSIFDHISKLMGRELNTSALEQREILFEKLMGFTKALFCIHIIGLRLSGLKVPLISETDLYGIFVVTGYEATAIVLDSKKYKLDEENTIFAINCLKILNEIPTKLYIAFL